MENERTGFPHEPQKTEFEPLFSEGYKVATKFILSVAAMGIIGINSVNFSVTINELSNEYQTKREVLEEYISEKSILTKSFLTIGKPGRELAYFIYEK